MFSLLRQRTMRCRVPSLPFIAACVLAFLICAQRSALAAAFDDANVSPLVVPSQTPFGPADSFVQLSPEQHGDIFMARREYAAAIRSYQQGPFMSAVVWNKIGIAYHHMFELGHAQRAYQNALKINPRYPEALNNLAAVYYAKGKYKKAERTYKKALDYLPEAAVIYSNLGTSYIAHAKYREGEQAYQTALNLDPNVFNPDGSARLDEASTREQLRAIYFYLACVYAKLGRTGEALGYLRQAFGEGLRDPQRLLADKDFDPIRASPEFRQLLVEQHLD